MRQNKLSGWEKGGLSPLVRATSYRFSFIVTFMNGMNVTAAVVGSTTASLGASQTLICVVTLGGLAEGRKETLNTQLKGKITSSDIEVR